MLPPGVLNAIAASHALGALGPQQSQLSEVQSLSATPKRRNPFPAWSAIDDVKKEAAREFEVASQKAQQKTGKIQPWTPKYYMACTIGGILACVSIDNCADVAK